MGNLEKEGGTKKTEPEGNIIYVYTNIFMRDTNILCEKGNKFSVTLVLVIN